MSKCSRCEGVYQLVREPHTIKFNGGREATVEVELFRCDACDDSFFTLEQADAARFLASKAVRRKEGLLMPEDITALRQRFGLSQVLLQRLLGKGKKTVVRWESGADFQGKLADKFLRVIRRFPAVMEFLAELEDVELPQRSGPGEARKSDLHAPERDGMVTVRTSASGNDWEPAGDQSFDGKLANAT